MSDMLHYVQEQVNKQSPLAVWLSDLQQASLAKLNEQGFPSRHDEEWKYTSVDGLLKQTFEPVHAIDEVISNQLAFQKTNLSTQNLPVGVLVLPLALAIAEYEDLVKPYLGKILESNHGFHWANNALMQHGMFVYIPEGVTVSEPIILNHRVTHANCALHLRHLIIAGRDSQASIIESYEGSNELTYLTNAITEVFLAPNADLTHYKIQREGNAAYHFGHLSVKQSEQSQFSSHAFSVGAKWMRSDINISLEKEHASCLLNGLYVPGDGQHMDHHTLIQHLVPNCRSGQDYKGILNGRARAVFNGKVLVAPNAQHTDASQHNKNLLLSSNAEIDTKPQLEIYADDVMCSHGATVGQLDEDALFYLATRGIEPQEAANFLIHAFTIDNFRLIPQRELADWMSHLITEQMG
jgi:Fe-S cluster assembly protein SufD